MTFIFAFGKVPPSEIDFPTQDQLQMMFSVRFAYTCTINQFQVIVGQRFFEMN